ncbi:hypothetical protein BJV78DRAFT_1175472 [Lactifluus subvellereus]|nr:hypothetical protein BJV78DRAFT_1175472 [Lactifluus subvellereus]
MNKAQRKSRGQRRVRSPTRRLRDERPRLGLSSGSQARDLNEEDSLAKKLHTRV